MSKVELYNKENPHYPLGMKVDVEEKKVDELLDSGFAKSSEKTTEMLSKKPKEKKEELPSMEWTEKRIKKFLNDNDIPIQYDITNENKEDKLKKLYEYLDKNG